MIDYRVIAKTLKILRGLLAPPRMMESPQIFFYKFSSNSTLILMCYFGPGMPDKKMPKIDTDGRKEGRKEGRKDRHRSLSHTTSLADFVS